MELQSDTCVVSQRGGGIIVCTAPGKKQCSLLQQMLGLLGEVTSTKDRNRNCISSLPSKVFLHYFSLFFLPSFLNSLAMSPALSLILRGDESSHLCWHFTAVYSQLSPNIRTEADLQAEDCCLFGVLELYIKSATYFSNQDYRINLHGLSSGIFFWWSRVRISFVKIFMLHRPYFCCSSAVFQESVD